jgi:lysozyme family protein
MADFTSAILKVLSHEGGYLNDPADSGGETYRGIARNPNPDWQGWPILDQIKQSVKPVTNQLFPALDSYVMSFYKSRFWNPLFDQITSQDTANAVLDTLTLHGIHAGSVLIQKALNDAGFKIAIDGQIGQETLNALNIAGAPFLTNLANERKIYVQHYAQQDPRQNKFLAGWISRFNSYAPKIASLSLIVGTAFFLPSI